MSCQGFVGTLLRLLLLACNLSQGQILPQPHLLPEPLKNPLILLTSCHVGVILNWTMEKIKFNLLSHGPLAE